MITPRQLEILQHALGVDQYGRLPRGFTEPTRNHFCAGGDDETDCRTLVAAGLMRTWAGCDDNGRVPGYPYYNCSATEAGIQYVRKHSPRAPKLTRAKRRYREFLDADTGYSFGEWLKAR